MKTFFYVGYPTCTSACTLFSACPLHCRAVKEMGSMLPKRNSRSQLRRQLKPKVAALIARAAIRRRQDEEVSMRDPGALAVQQDCDNRWSMTPFGTSTSIAYTPILRLG